MAKASTYPNATPEAGDALLGTTTALPKRTKNFDPADVAALFVDISFAVSGHGTHTVDTHLGNAFTAIGVVASDLAGEASARGSADAALNTAIGAEATTRGNADTSISNALAAHIAATPGAHAASAISFTAGGTISSTDVQAAVAEVASETATALGLRVTGPGASTADHLVTWDGSTGFLVKDSGKTFDTDGTFGGAGGSDAKIPTQKAVDTFVLAQISADHLTDVDVSGLGTAGSFSGTDSIIVITTGGLKQAAVSVMDARWATLSGFTMAGNITMGGHDLVSDATTGTSLGTATTDKVGLYGAKVARQSSTVDIRTALINLNVFPTGGANPLNTNGGTITAGTGVFSGNVTIGSSGTPVNLSVPGSGGSGAEAIGTGALAAGSASLAVGGTSSAAGGGATAIGPSASASASNAMAIGGSANSAFGSAIAMGVSTVTTATNQFVLGANVGFSTLGWVTDLYAGTGVKDVQGSPQGFTLHGTSARSGTDTNVAGASITITPGLGTGTGSGGSLILQSVVATTTGTAAGTATTVVTITPAATGAKPTMVYADGINETFNATTGTKHGTTTTGKQGWFNAAPVGQQTGPAGTITNSVTSGGTTNTIADFAASSYATDAATIRNDIFQLARIIKLLSDGLRTYGFFT